ncbi:MULTISPECIES: hypothetical protein [unclassified Microbacterium]|uniref:hypothetical protein n=1 Tax=unclassified Microbacterium TaxID=2609290 RepID=UPI000EAA5FFC|nr:MULTISPECIES: hypothetical protein [unclassified Microbacterium]MBT2486448.1 hypothetical protein [Microbacterium sp. ISL-108]RKN69147.1 hypothetical protein D7252_17250 [Microbacterium sp. CGR2]
MTADVHQADPQIAGTGRGRVIASYVLASLVVLALTLRFPPGDFTGWMATSLSTPLWVAYLILAAISLVGFLLTLNLERRYGRSGARWMNLILLVGTLLSTVGELITGSSKG